MSIELAFSIAQLSNAHDKKVGVVLVDAMQSYPGWNYLPDSVSRVSRASRRAGAIHAEQVALAIRASHGSTAGFVCYSTNFPCSKCAALLMAAGMQKLVTIRPDFSHQIWGQSYMDALHAMECVTIEFTQKENV